MERLRKFIRLPPEDKRLLVKTVLTVAAVRLGLWSLPFKFLRGLLTRLENGGHKVRGKDFSHSVERIAWAVEITSQVVPSATCFTQALATKLLLCRQGYQPVLRIGVAKNKVGELEAHAWVENDGRIIVGWLRDLSRYTSLPPLADEHRPDLRMTS